MKQKQKLALYVRTATSDPFAVENQLHQLTEYAKLQGHEYIPYIDDGFKGTNYNRPGLQQMLRDVEDGKVLGIVAVDSNRLGRTMGTISFLIDFAAKYGIGLSSLKEGELTSDFYMNLKAVQKQLER